MILLQIYTCRSERTMISVLDRCCAFWKLRVCLEMLVFYNIALWDFTDPWLEDNFIVINRLFSFLCVLGLSAPVPRGRKGKKLKNQLNVPGEVKNADWLVHCNPEVVLQDESYKKHLKQHCNKSVHLQLQQQTDACCSLTFDPHQTLL